MKKLVSTLLVGVMAITLVFSLSACSGSKTMDLNQYFGVKFNGLDSMGTAEVVFDRESFNTDFEETFKKQIEQAEKEVTDLHQRTKEGIETARLAGKQIGLKKGTKLTTQKSIVTKEKILTYSKDFHGTLNDTDCIKLLGIARNTFYKYKAELKEN